MKVFISTLAAEIFLAWLGGCQFPRCADTAYAVLIMILIAGLVAFAAGLLDAME